VPSPGWAGNVEADGLRVRTFTREVPFRSGSGCLAPELEASDTLYWRCTSVNPAVAEERPDLVAYDHDQFTALLRGLELVRDAPRVVLLSSGGTVYDPASGPPYREDSPVGGTTAYARAKLELERALHSADLPAAAKVVVRAANAYGPGQPARRGQGVIAHWLNAARRGDPLVLLGERDTVRDFVHIDDLVDAMVRLDACAGGPPPILNVGSGARTSLGDLAEIVLRVVDDPALTFEVRPARPFDRPSTWLDIGLAARTLGWRPRTPMTDGVASAWRHLREHGPALTARTRGRER
jgi:UDP-glucose 4-epimerase